MKKLVLILLFLIITLSVFVQMGISFQLNCMEKIQQKLIDIEHEQESDKSLAKRKPPIENQLENEIKDLMLYNQRRLRNFLILIIILIMIITVILYILYMAKVIAYKKQKERTNYILELSNDLIKLNKELKESARIDYLTQLSNRRDLLEKIKYEQKRFERSKKTFALVMGDIDDFKSINDRYGHEGGDFVLVAIAKLMKSAIRKQDVIGRWGGEEFLLFLPETGIQGGMKLAEKIRLKVKENIYNYKGKNIPVTITFGVNIYDKIDEIDSCINGADKALFKGKAEGKDWVVSAREIN